MNIEINDVLTLSDKNEYLVVSKISYKDKQYYYIADINNSNSLKFCYIDNNELVEINNENLILELLPLFKKEINI